MIKILLFFMCTSLVILLFAQSKGAKSLASFTGGQHTNGKFTKLNSNQAEIADYDLSTNRPEEENYVYHEGGATKFSTFHGGSSNIGVYTAVNYDTPTDYAKTKGGAKQLSNFHGGSSQIGVFTEVNYETPPDYVKTKVGRHRKKHFKLNDVKNKFNKPQGFSKMYHLQYEVPNGSKERLLLDGNIKLNKYQEFDNVYHHQYEVPKSKLEHRNTMHSSEYNDDTLEQHDYDLE